MSDFYWFGLPVNLAPCLGSWDVYFLLQGLLNGGNLGFFRGIFLQISQLDLIIPICFIIWGLECIAMHPWFLKRKVQNLRTVLWKMIYLKQSQYTQKQIYA